MYKCFKFQEKKKKKSYLVPNIKPMRFFDENVFFLQVVFDVKYLNLLSHLLFSPYVFCIYFHSQNRQAWPAI